tara:strand:- start:925 stop:1389 length:465 start_codon:yes stop_codon:yes gene_type:complete
MTRKILWVVLAVLIASPAGAINEWLQCGSTTNTATGIVRTDNCVEYRIDENVSVAQRTTTFTVATESAVICLDPDIGAVGNAGACTAMISRCLDPGAAASANNCTEILTSALDGTPGSSDVQKLCLRVSRGDYMAVLVAPGSGEIAVLQVRGEF